MDQKKSLIIGKNSRVVREIYEFLDGFDMISHTEIRQTNMNIYNKIYLFSWSHGEFKENIEMIKSLDLSKVCFISSIAVLALLKRRQWAQYPNEKAQIEKTVLDAGGQVIRIGIWGDAQAKKVGGFVPLTTSQILVKTLHASLNSNEKVFHAFELTEFASKRWQKSIEGLFGFLSDIVPSHMAFQLPFTVSARLLKLKRYNYTRDCLHYFQQRVLIGYGAIGSAIGKEAKKNNVGLQVVVSPKANQLWSKNGFVNTMIGYDQIGLSGYWHGVSIEDDLADGPRKKVPLIVKRPKLPIGTIKMHVDELIFSKSHTMLASRHEYLSSVGIFTNQVHLAAGIYQNISLLMKHIGTAAICVSDHELLNLGTIDKNELLEKSFVKKRGFVIFGRKVDEFELNGRGILLDFRPSAQKRSGAINNDLIYANRTVKIVAELLKNFSFSTINQAVFNKFGFALDITEKFDVYAQIECDQCITIYSSTNIERSRIETKELTSIQDYIGSKYSNFKALSPPKSVDAIHLYGRLDALDTDLEPYIKNNSLVIYCQAPEGERLGGRHHTRRLIEESLRVFKSISILKPTKFH